MPPATQAASDGGKKLKGPRPIHTLLAGILSALDAGVPVTKISASVSMCLEAQGTEQSYVYRMAARSLTTQARKLDPDAVVEPPSYNGDDSDDDEDDA